MTAKRISSEDSSSRVTVNTTVYEGKVRSTLLTLGSNNPDGDLEASHDYWKHCLSAGISPEVCAATIYSSIRHKHVNTGHAQTATLKESEAQSPTREEWEVVVRRAGSDADAITAAAGRRPTEVTAGNAIFAGFNDDEKAVAFARKMTNAGYIASSGPSRASNLHEAAEDAGGWWLVEFADGETGRRHHIHVRGWDKSEAIHNADAAMKKAGHTIDYREGMTVRRTFTEGYKVNEPLKDAVKPKLDEAPAEDPSAMELAPVISEPSPVISETGIPWNKVSRDPKAHASNMELAAKHGAIRNAKDVYALVGVELNKEDSEVFLVIPLNLRGELKAAPYECARGQRSRVSVDPADVLRAALDAGAEGYIAVHQHPTGKAKPSKADIDLTEQLKAATKPYGKSLCILDHVVIGNGEAYSIFERKMYKC
jgi:DNA repair protein RadC